MTSVSMSRASLPGNGHGGEGRKAWAQPLLDGASGP